MSDFLNCSLDFCLNVQLRDFVFKCQKLQQKIIRAIQALKYVF